MRSIDLTLVAAISLGVAVLTLIIWAIFGMMRGETPWWVWIAVLVMLGAFGGETNQRSRRRRSSTRYGSSRSMSFGERVQAALLSVLMSLLGLALVWWAFMGGGLAWALRSMGAFGVDSPTPTQELSAPVSAAPTLGQAQLALTEAAPDIAAKVTNITSPVVTSRAPYTVFTWEYIDQPDAASATVHTISLSLDANGEVWGVEIQ